jgi:2,4-dienoyl-CoA reductase-like NADH-dependent reductase (Old Yellow Enzyme family)
MSVLYSPVTFGPYTFKNRLVMSLMTRSRALGNVSNDLMLEYYKQRASSAGLIVTEGTSPSPNGIGYPRVPGITRSRARSRLVSCRHRMREARAGRRSRPNAAGLEL